VVAVFTKKACARPLQNSSKAIWNVSTVAAGPGRVQGANFNAIVCINSFIAIEGTTDDKSVVVAVLPQMVKLPALSPLQERSSVFRVGVEMAVQLNKFLTLLPKLQ
jgi:hypothetical protein